MPDNPRERYLDLIQHFEACVADAQESLGPDRGDHDLAIGRMRDARKALIAEIDAMLPLARFGAAIVNSHGRYTSGAGTWLDVADEIEEHARESGVLDAEYVVEPAVLAAAERLADA